MVDMDLRGFSDDEFVLHFGGRPSEVDAVTFSTALLAIAEAIQESNRQVNPDFSIEIAIDGAGTGSFRAKLRTTSKSIAGLFKHRYTETILLGLLVNFIWDKTHPTEKPVIIVNDDSYVVQYGSDRIILPKHYGDARRKISNLPAINKQLAKTFDALQEDPSVKNFGFVGHIRDEHPLAVMPADKFALRSRAEEDDAAHNDLRHIHDERSKVTVLKAILERGDRKWQFVWNGIKISAPIRSSAFFDSMAKREYEFGQGDVLDVTLRITRVRDEMAGVFINEKYEIIEVHGLEKSLRQQSFLPPR